jgi:hypothetical protein
MTKAAMAVLRYKNTRQPVSLSFLQTARVEIRKVQAHE